MNFQCDDKATNKKLVHAYHKVTDSQSDTSAANVEAIHMFSFYLTIKYCIHSLLPEQHTENLYMPTLLYHTSMLDANAVVCINYPSFGLSLCGI